MAGAAFCETVVKIGITAIDDVTEWNIALGAELLSSRSYGLKYPQEGCAVNHTATVGVKTLDLGAAPQASSSSLLIGSSVDSISIVSDNIDGTAGTFSMTPARYTNANAQGSHGRLADMDLAWEAIGSAGVEPAVVFGVVA